MQICPQCRTVYPAAGADRCARDGSGLVDAEAFSQSEGDPLLGHVIAGRFRITARIGIGGMGTVYRATQSGLDRDVAVKILKRDSTWDKDTVTRFHREAKAMSLLVHQNTVRVFDFGETDDGLLFLAMELLEGEVLSHKLDRQGTIDVVESIRIAQQILRSLHEAHSKGIIHRDLKPDNIVLTRVEGHDEMVVKVLDFGIAKVVQGDRRIDQLETQAGTVFGTPRYMSPEQAQGKPLDARSDVYSVGILLYHLLVGRPPFVDDDAVVVMAKHIKERPVSPRRAAPEQPIPTTLDRVIMRTLEKDRERRVQSAADLVRRLDVCVSDVAVELEARSGGKPRRSRAPIVPVLIAALLVLSATAVGIHLAIGSVPDAAPPQAAAPPKLDAILQTDPNGAEVWHGDQHLGPTPLDRLLAPGQRLVVELRKDGYMKTRSELVAGQTRTVQLAPTPPAPTPAVEPPPAERAPVLADGNGGQEAVAAPTPAPSTAATHHVRHRTRRHHAHRAHHQGRAHLAHAAAGQAPTVGPDGLQMLQ